MTENDELEMSQPTPPMGGSSDDEHTATSGPTDSDGTQPSHGPTPLLPPVLRTDLAPRQMAVIMFVSVVLLLASGLGGLSWVITVSAIATMLTTLIAGWRKITLLGAALVALLVLTAVVTSTFGRSDQLDVSSPATLPPVDPHPPAPGSLGIYVDQVTDSWNTVAGPPRIVRGLTRNNEIGEYDTFIYRFGEWGRLAGAYEPNSEAIYALMATGQFSGPGTDQMYIGLCFLTAPYSQECLEAYSSNGLADGVLSDYSSIEHEAEWMVEENRWTLETSGDVLTIRVFAPDA